MKNIFLEFHARVITKITFPRKTLETTKVLDQQPIPVLNQIDDNACVCITLAVACWIVSRGSIWINPMKMFTSIWNSYNGMSFVEAFLYLIDNHEDVFQAWSIRRMGVSIDNLKNCIQHGFPVMIGYRVPGEIQKFHESGDEIMPNITNVPTTTDGHAVVVIGFEEDYFICLNSWGVIYGRSGMFKFPITNIQLITDAYTIIPRTYNDFELE